MNQHFEEPVHDRKTRRKLEDARRMAFRRAIEALDEQRRLQHELDDYPDLLPAGLSPQRVAPRRQAA